MGRLLVVLDLNGTLLQRLKCDASLRIARKMNPSLKSDAKIHGRPVVNRPGARKFLEDLMEIADVAIWTSAQAKNAVPMVMVGFGGLLDKEYWNMENSGMPPAYAAEVRQCYLNFSQREDIPQATGSKRLSFLWAQEQCDIVGHTKGARGKGDFKPEFVKNLGKIWKSYPDLYTPSNTLIIDDSEKKIPKAMRSNLICIPEFDVERDPISVLSDNTLPDLAEYLKKAVEACPSDIRHYMTETPFNRIFS